MTKSFTQAEFSQSRSICVEAAMSILAIQSDMLDEKKYGPILRASKGLISSLEQTDFILAATIICLELSSGSPEVPPTTQEHPTNFTRKDLLEALHASHRLLARMKDASADCQQAYQIVSHIIQWLDRREGAHTSYQIADSVMALTAGAHCTVDDQASRSVDTSEAEDQTGTSAQTTNPSTMLPDPFSPSLFDSSGMESFFDDPHSADWVRNNCDVPCRVQLLTLLRTFGRRSFVIQTPDLMLDA
jgi:hypothetical protein